MATRFAAPWHPVKLVTHVMPGQAVRIRPSPREAEQFGITKPERAVTEGYLSPLQLLLWRRWLMLLLVPVSLAVAIWTTINEINDINEFEDEQTFYRTVDAAEFTPLLRAYGSTVYTETNRKVTTYLSVVTIVSRWLPFLFITLAFAFNTNWTRSRNLLLYGWVSPFVLTMVVYSMPMKRLFQLSNVFSELKDRAVAIPELQAELANATLADFLITNLLFDQLDVYWNYFLLAWFSAESIKVIAPASLSLLPALARGANLAKLMAPESLEVAWLMRVVPMLYLPLVGIVLAIIVQLTASWLVMAAMYMFAAGFVVPVAAFGRRLVGAAAETNQEYLHIVRRSKLIRMVFALAGLVLIVAFLFSSEGQHVEDLIYTIDAKTVALFLLQFGVSFFSTTILAVDYIITFLVSIEDGRERSGPAATAALTRRIMDMSEELGVIESDMADMKRASIQPRLSTGSASINNGGIELGAVTLDKEFSEPPMVLMAVSAADTGGSSVA